MVICVILILIVIVISFHKWLKSDKGIKSSKGAQLGILRMKLQSKAWMTKLNDLRTKIKKTAADAKGIYIYMINMINMIISHLLHAVSLY